MNDTLQSPQNGTVEVITLKSKDDGRYVLAIAHVDRNGEPEIVGMNYPDMDTAKSAAWELAKQLGAVMRPTRRVRS